VSDQAPRIAVAYSGGRDSTALLHATVAAAADAGVEVVALHVHHGLSPNADAWLRHCEAQCARWARAGRPLLFAASRLTDAPARGDSIEAWARSARYAALRSLALAQRTEVVLLAHHRRDQAETVLLQALRGAGHAGLAAMPRQVLRDGIVWERPWLDRPREAIDAYMRRHRLKHIEDDSNADPRYARNRLRLQVWPALTAAFPQAEASLATAAGWAQEAGEALRELAQLDLADLADASGLQIAAWRALSPARRSNALRSWLPVADAQRPSAALATRLLAELPTCTAARWPIDGGELRLYRGVLSHHRRTAAPAAAAREAVLSVRRAGVYRLPGWAGALRVERTGEDGVPFAWLANLELRERVGSERFQAGPARPARSLKKQYQQAGLPAWQRSGPLIYSGGQLVFVPGLGLDARIIGLPRQALARLRWEPIDAAG
jgi:tRNA(Ile)-lysidine synthase